MKLHCIIILLTCKKIIRVHLAYTLYSYKHYSRSAGYTCRATSYCLTLVAGLPHTAPVYMRGGMFWASACGPVSFPPSGSQQHSEGFAQASEASRKKTVT